MVIPEHPFANKEILVRVFCFRRRAIVTQRARVIMGSESRLLVRLDNGEVRSIRAKDTIEESPPA